MEAWLVVPHGKEVVQPSTDDENDIHGKNYDDDDDDNEGDDDDDDDDDVVYTCHVKAVYLVVLCSASLLATPEHGFHHNH